MSEKRV